MKRLLLLAPLALAACDKGPTGDPEPFAGVYHLPDGPDTVNVELREDGTFRTLLHGCDYDGGTSGTWSVDGETIVLVAAGAGDQRWKEGVCPTACFSWPYRGPEGEGLSAPVDELRLTEQPDGTFSASFFDHTQDWEVDGQVVAPGGMCLTCGEGQAPCDDPFSHDQWPAD